MMDLLLRRRQMMMQSFPYDSRVDFLESTGTQYIQLPLNVSSSSYFAVGGCVIPVYLNTNKYAIFGANPHTQFNAAFYSYNSSTQRITYSTTVGTTAGSGGITLTVGTKNTFEVSTLGRTANGTYNSYARSLTANITGFRLFGRYTYTTRYPIKICSLYMIVDNTKVYDLIPVRIGQVGYMYDKISKQLFGNSGSDDFILGNDI